MSAEDCILYRKINGDWYVLGYGFTWDEYDWDDERFIQASERFEKLENALARLEELKARNVTEHGILYTGEFKSDAPPEIPESHKILCCMSDEFKDKP